MTQASPVKTSTTAVIDIRKSRKAILGSSLGTLAEWYEFGIYAYMAPIIAGLFFPSENKTAGILATFALFALAYFMRPVGAFIFGRLTDRVGRRSVLIVIVALMTVATTAIGLLPTYAAIGVWAPILLTVLRILQGISAGGELGGAVSLMVESAPEGKRGLYASWSFLTTTLGYVLGGGVATLLAVVLSEDAMSSWGWRIGFLLAAPLGIIIIFLRRSVDETVHFKNVVAAREAGALDDQSVPGSKERPVLYLLTTVGLVVVFNAVGNTFMVGMPTFMRNSYGLTFESAYFLALVTGLIGALTIPIFGALSDRVGRWPVLFAGTAGVLILSYPLYAMLGSGFGMSLLALSIGGLLIGVVGGPLPAMMSERFPTRNRATGVSVSYAVSVSVFGGSAPFVITWLADITGDPRAAAYYTMVCAAISLLALAGVRGKQKNQHLTKLVD